MKGLFIHWKWLGLTVFFALVVLLVWSNVAELSIFLSVSFLLILLGFLAYFQNDWKSRLIQGGSFFLLLWLGIAAIYHPVLNIGFFTWDDPVTLLTNPLVKDFSFTKAFFTSPEGMYQPMVHFTYYVDYLLNGMNAGGFHAGNILLHTLNSLLLLFLFRLLGVPTRLSYLTVLLFAFHYASVEPVVWLTARKDLLFSLFFLLGLIFYLYSQKIESVPKKRVVQGLLVLSYLLSLLSKPQAVTFPVVLLLIDYWKNDSFDWKKSLWSKGHLFVLALFFGFLVFYFAQGEVPDVSWINRIILSAYALSFYVWTAIYPFHVSLFEPFPLVLEWYHYASLIIIPLLGGLLYFARKQKRVISLTLYVLVQLFFLLPLFPNSFILSANRYLYLSLPALMLALVYFLHGIFPRSGTTLVSILLLVFAYFSYAHVQYWELPSKWWDLEVKQHPHSEVAQNNRAYAYYLEGNPEEALRSYTRSIQIAPKRFEAYAGRSAILIEQKRYDEALSDLSAALQLYPEHAISYYNRALIYQSQGLYEKALSDFNQSLQLDAYQPNAYLSRGALQLNLGNYDKALIDLNEAATIDPTNYLTYSNRGLAYVRKNQLNKAEQDFSRAIQLNPDFPDAYSNRGMIYFNLGEYGKAITDFNYALRRAPQMVVAIHNRGRAYLASGNLRMACKDFTNAANLGFEPARIDLEANCSPTP